MDKDLADVVAEIQDRTAILELVARYNRAADDGDHEAWVATYTEDGVFSVGSEIRGRPALMEYISKSPFGTVHLTLNPILVIDGDHATHSCSFILGRRTKDRTRNELLATGRYHDDLRRTPEGWRFSRREFASDISSEALAARFGT